MKKNNKNTNNCSTKNHQGDKKKLKDYQAFERNLRNYLPFPLLYSEGFKVLPRLGEKGLNDQATQSSSSDDVYFELQEQINAQQILDLLNKGPKLLKDQTSTTQSLLIKLHPPCNVQEISLKEKEIFLSTMALSMRNTNLEDKQSHTSSHSGSNSAKKDSQEQYTRGYSEIFKKQDIEEAKGIEAAQFLQECKNELISKVQRLQATFDIGSNENTAFNLTIFYICNRARKYGCRILEALEENLQYQISSKYIGCQVRLLVFFASYINFQKLQRLLLSEQQIEILHKEAKKKKQLQELNESPQRQITLQEQVLVQQNNNVAQDTQNIVKQDPTTAINE